MPLNYIFIQFKFTESYLTSKFDHGAEPVRGVGTARACVPTSFRSSKAVLRGGEVWAGRPDKRWFRFSAFYTPALIVGETLRSS